MNKKNTSCIFCNIYINRDIIYENDFFFSQFDKFPATPGHAEVIPIRHVVSLFDLSKEEWKFLQTALNETIKIIEKTNLKQVYFDFIELNYHEKSVYFSKLMINKPWLNKKPDAYNIGINEGRAAGRTIDHLHIHILPRYLGDTDNPIGGIRKIISGMGDYT